MTHRDIGTRMIALVPLWMLAACVDERGPRPAEDEVEYAGYLYQGPDVSEETRLAEGSVQFLPDGADAEIDALQPYEDYPGYWSVTLPAAVGYTLRIEAESAYPAVWAGTAPANDGSWFGGALFGGDAAQVDDFLASLGLAVEAETVTVIGSPWDAEAWDCAAVTISGAAPSCFLQDPETGLLSEVREGALTWFVETGVPAGDVTLDSGLGGVHTWPTIAGDIVYAFWFQGAPS